MASKFMIDSGAYSVWSRGAKIDIADYIRFCVDHPEVDYYVNLDVLLGKKGDTSKSTEMIEEACRGSWENYLEMIRHLPQEKVLAVYHRGENSKWLEKYLDVGCPYVGIGQSNAGDWDDRSRWFRYLKEILLDSTGKPIVKTHGFAVTGIQNMLGMPWTSVDSASWIKSSGYGLVQIPRVGLNGKFRYDVSPFTLSFSPRWEKSSSIGGRWHYELLPKRIRVHVDRYLSELKLEVGKSVRIEVEPGYQLQKTKEIWLNGGRHPVAEVQEPISRIIKIGLTNCYQRRFYANKVFYERMGKATPVEDLYLAGGEAAVFMGVERTIEKRLLSYYAIMRKPSTAKAFHSHIGRVS